MVDNAQIFIIGVPQTILGLYYRKKSSFYNNCLVITPHGACHFPFSSLSCSPSFQDRLLKSSIYTILYSFLYFSHIYTLPIPSCSLNIWSR